MNIKIFLIFLVFNVSSNLVAQKTIHKKIKSKKSSVTPIIKLPNEYNGSWIYSLESNNCVVGGDFSIDGTGNSISLEFGTELGGYNGKLKKYSDHYILKFVAKSEGESWNSSLLFYYSNGNLFLDREEPLNVAEAEKMFRCDN